jgi:hypothetical protein
MSHTDSPCSDISTSYVDRLHGDAPHGHSHSHGDPYLESYGHSHPNPHVLTDNISHVSADLTAHPTSSSSLLRHPSHALSYSSVAPTTRGRPRPHTTHETSSYFSGHHRYEPRSAHAGHGRTLSRSTPGGLNDIYKSHTRSSSIQGVVEPHIGETHNELGNGDADDEEHNHVDNVLSRKRQVVSILVRYVRHRPLIVSHTSRSYNSGSCFTLLS